MAMAASIVDILQNAKKHLYYFCNFETALLLLIQELD